MGSVARTPSWRSTSGRKLSHVPWASPRDTASPWLRALTASRLHPESWFPLQRVIRALGVIAPPPEGLLTPRQAAAIVEQHFTELDGDFGRRFTDRTRTTLVELERFAMKRLIDRAKATE